MMGYADDIMAKQNFNEFDLYPKFTGTLLHLELSNICNHKCIFCSNRLMERKRAFMDEAFAHRIIKEAADLGVKELALFSVGEPFMTPNLEEYVAFAKKCGIEYVFVTTNGGLATPDRLKKVFDAGLDSIKFSINAGSSETYKLVHGVDDYEKVMRHLKYAHAYREESKLKYKILSSFVVTSHTESEVEKQRDAVKPYVDDFVWFYCENLGGTMENDTIKPLRKDDFIRAQWKLPCPQLFNTITITVEGYLTLCCNDYTNYLAVEDLNEMSLRDAWHSPLMTKIRERHLQGDVKGIQCHRCIFGGGRRTFPCEQKAGFMHLKVLNSCVRGIAA